MFARTSTGSTFSRKALPEAKSPPHLEQHLLQMNPGKTVPTEGNQMNSSGVSEGLIALTLENNPFPDGGSGATVESAQEVTTDGAVEFATEIYERYVQSCATVPGWFFPVSAAIWDTLLSYQVENNIRGNLMEIGVYKGKSAVMAALHSQANETCVLVDPMPLDDVRQRIEYLVPQTQCQYLQEKSQYLLRYAFLREAARDFRWIHIDGEHTAEAVSNDLSIAETLLCDRGILAVDHFFSPSYPQITLAVFRFLEANPNRLALILCGYNKGYLCRPKAAREYLTFIRSSLYPNLAKRNCQRVTVCKTTEPADMNTFGVIERFNDMDYRGPDWDLQNIYI